MEYMFVNKPEFAEPIRVLFLCGSRFKDSAWDKRIILKEYLEEDPRNKVILLEKYFDFALKKNPAPRSLLSYYDAHLFNLYSIESFAALTATNIIILHETLSTAGEIGVFGSSEALRERMITLVPEKFSVEEEKLSSFLRLAFWSARRQLIPHHVIRFFPKIKRAMVSETASYYETFFPDNQVPNWIKHSLHSQLDHSPRSPVAVLHKNKYFYRGGTLSVWLSYASVKNYLLALLSVKEIRTKLRSCQKLYQVRNTLQQEFISAVRHSYFNAWGSRPKSVKVYIDQQPSFAFSDVLYFMIYFWHACHIITITPGEADTITLRFSKNTASLFQKYSALIQPVSFADWGE